MWACANVLLTVAHAGLVTRNLNDEIDTQNFEPVGNERNIPLDYTYSDEDETNTPPIDIKVSLQQYKETKNSTYWLGIHATAPIYRPTFIPPPSSKLSSDDYNPFELLNTDDAEHIRVYFSNPEDRLTEIRFNRFHQQFTQLLSKPYNVLNPYLKETILTISVSPDKKSWTALMLVPTDRLPAKMNGVNIAVIDPTQPTGGARYHNYYRVYNHPLSSIDLQVIPRFFKINKPTELVPEEVNSDYSDLWNGLKYGS